MWREAVFEQKQKTGKKERWEEKEDEMYLSKSKGGKKDGVF